MVESHGPFYSPNQWDAYVDKSPLYLSVKIIKSNIYFQHVCYQHMRGEFSSRAADWGKKNNSNWNTSLEMILLEANKNIQVDLVTSHKVHYM